MIFQDLNETPESIKNIELEQCLLGFLLKQNEAFYHLPADFLPEHFSEPLHQLIFTKIKDFVSVGEGYDPIILAKYFLEIKKDYDQIYNQDFDIKRYLINISAKYALLFYNPSEAAKQLIDLANRRKIIDFCQDAIAKAGRIESDETSGEIAANLTNLMQNLETSHRFRISTEREVSERLVKKVQNGKPLERSSSGFYAIDEAMGGGMFAGKLYGIVGRKKMGKTMLAGTISHNLQNAGVKHIYLALEMGSDEIQQRNLARQVGCKEAVFRLGVNVNLLQKMAEYATQTQNHRIYFDTPSISFDDLRHILPQYIRKYKIKGFILDCWQLVGGKKKWNNTAEHLDEVAQWLAECCKKYDIWGLVTAQENKDENTRGGEGLRLAVDQLYRINKKAVEDTDAWLEMMETRYTRWIDVGSENNPSLTISENGTHYEPIGSIAA